MKIAVCINHVPDTETKVKIGSDGKSLEKGAVNYVLNPYDEFAVEEALRMKEKHGGEVIAMSLGGDAHKETLRKALAMGVDKAVLLKDDAVRDSLGIARVLSDALREMSPDVVWVGKQSVDYDNAAMAGLVGGLLDMPSVSIVVKVEIQDGKIVCEREIEGGHEVVESRLPAVLASQKGLNEPRYPSLKGIMGAKSKPIEEKPVGSAKVTVEVLQMRKPNPKKAGRIVGTDVGAVPELVRLLHEEAKVV